MADPVVCPTCGSEVPDDRLSEDQQLAELRDRLEIPYLAGRLFLALWRADQRILSRETLIDLLQMHGMEPSDDALMQHIKHMRKAVRDSGMPVQIDVFYGVGYRMQRYPGWHWRDLKTLLELRVEQDDFHFNFGG